VKVNGTFDCIVRNHKLPQELGVYADIGSFPRGDILTVEYKFVTGSYSALRMPTVVGLFYGPFADRKNDLFTKIDVKPDSEYFGQGKGTVK